MESSLDISWLQLSLFSMVLLIPLLINRYYQLEMTKEVIISALRMLIQLILVGLYTHCHSRCKNQQAMR